MKIRKVLASLVVASFFICMPAFSQAPMGGPGMAPPSADPLQTPTGASTEDAEFQQRLQRIDAMVNDRMQALNIPGYCLAVIRNGNVVFQKPYGFANVQTRQPVTNDTIFGLASLTKTFTAFTLLSLVDRGLVGLDDPLSKYVDGLTPAYKTLTLRQLASMIGGVPAKLPQELPWKEQLGMLVNTPLESQPGSTFLYSNYSYRLLGSVIEKVTGQPFLEVVERTICGPFNMRSTGTAFLLQPTGRVAQAYGDNNGNGPLREIDYKNPAVQFSAGMLASTSTDLINYSLNLLAKRNLSPDAYKTMWFTRPPLSTGQPSKWAFGWANTHNKNMGGQLNISMNGGVPGVASTIILLPESNSAVIALCNLRKPPVYQIARMAAVMAFGTGDEQAPEEETHGVGAD